MVLAIFLRTWELMSEVKSQREKSRCRQGGSGPEGRVAERPRGARRESPWVRRVSRMSLWCGGRPPGARFSAEMRYETSSHHCFHHPRGGTRALELPDQFVD